MEKNAIKTQGDFDRQMNELQEELRNIMCPLKLREEDLRVELGELSLKKQNYTSSSMSRSSTGLTFAR